MSDKVFITSAGIEVPYRAVSDASMKRIAVQVENEFKEKGEPVEPLTYAAGADSFEHDQESIDDPETDDETRAAWKAHLEAVGRMKRAQNRRTHRARLIKGVMLKIPDGWAEGERMLGAFVPDDPVDLKIAYLEDVFVTYDDWVGILKGIAGAALEGAGEEALQAMEELFQREMGKQTRSVLARASGEDESGGGDVVSPPEAHDSNGPETVGDQE